MQAMRVNHGLLLGAFVLASISGLAHLQAPLEPWLSILCLAAVFWVHRRLSAAPLRKAIRRDLRTARHVHIQDRTILLCLVIGVITAFQWLLSLKQFEPRSDMRGTLQAVSWILFVVALAHPVVGLALTWARPKPIPRAPFAATDG